MNVSSTFPREISTVVIRTFSTFSEIHSLIKVSTDLLDPKRWNGLKFHHMHDITCDAFM